MATALSTAAASQDARSNAGSKPFFECLFAELERQAVRYCVLHSYETLPDAAASDVDMALRGADLRLLPAVFEHLKVAGYQLLQCLEYETGSCYFVFAWWNGKCLESTAIDFTNEHREGNLILRSGDELTKERIREKSFWIPSPAMEFEYLYSKKVLKGTIGTAQASRLSALCQQLGAVEATRCAARLFGSHNAQYAVDLCLNGAVGREVRTLQQQLRAALHSRVPYPRLRYYLTDVRRRLRRLAKPSGTFISVLGPDGSGKSTVIANLLDGSKSLYRSQKVFHWRPRFLFSGRGREASTSPHAQSPHGAIRSVLRALMHVADYQLGYWAYVRPRTTRSSLVVFDRYFDDMLVDPLRYRYGGPMWVLRLLRKLVPQPDLQIVLDAPVDVVLTRKQEQHPAEIIRQRSAYRGLAAGGNTVVVDASMDAQSVGADALREIADLLAAKVERSHQAWLLPVPAEDSFEEIVRCFVPKQQRGTRTKEYLALPSVHNPRWLLPLDDGVVLPGAWDVYTPYSTKAKIFKWIIAENPMAARWMRRYVVAADRIPLDLDSLAREVTGRNDIRLTFSFGEARATRKLTVQVMAGDGKILGFIKVPLTPLARERVQHEASMLFLLESYKELEGHLPRMLFGGQWRGEFVLFQSAVPGAKGLTALTDGHFELLEKLGRIGGVAVDGEKIVDQVRREWSAVKNKSVYSPRLVVEDVLAWATRQVNDVDVRCSFSHGDFAPWNTRMHNGHVCLFDWEAASPCAPQAWDRFHFLTQCSALLAKNMMRLDAMSSTELALFSLYLIHSLSDQLTEDAAGRSVSVRMKLLRDVRSMCVVREGL